MTKRLIDRDKFMQVLECDKYGHTDCVKIGIALDKAQVVTTEDLRCNDCRNCEVETIGDDSVYCMLHKGWFDKNAYCSYGKRREEE